MKRITEDNRRAETIEHDRRYCQHYEYPRRTGLEAGQCKAGVCFGEQFGVGPGIMLRMCCTKGNERSREEQLAACPKWERRTIEQAEARADSLEASMIRMRLVMPAVAKWRDPHPCKGKAEIVKCPACAGKLHLSQSCYNGHVWGACETEGCVSWIE